MPRCFSPRCSTGSGAALHALRDRGRREAPRRLPGTRPPPRGGDARGLPRRPQGVLFAHVRGFARRSDPPARFGIRGRRVSGGGQGIELSRLRRCRHRFGLPGAGVYQAHLGPFLRDRDQPRGPAHRREERRSPRPGRSDHVPRRQPPRTRRRRRSVRRDPLQPPLHPHGRHPHPGTPASATTNPTAPSTAATTACGSSNRF